MNNLRNTHARRTAILQVLKENSTVSVKEICEKFDVSEVTVRKDLRLFHDRNLLMRTRGGAIRAPKNTEDENDLPISHKQLFYYKEKQLIGRLAASLIKDGETILLDAGTTTMEIARNLHHLTKLTVITNALNIAVELSNYKRFNVIMLGGYLRATSQSVVGPIAESDLKVFYCDKLFLGVDSFNIECGVSTPNIEEANLNQVMLSMTKEVIAVFDSSKFNKRSFVLIAPVNKLNTVVTDEGIPPTMKRQLKSMGIEVLVAKS